jgi:1-acyl-sn-glycerol-3-phosphate acyltransferase
MAPRPDRPGNTDAILPARWDARFFSFFAWYSRRLVSRHFHALRLATCADASPEGLDTDGRPLIVALSHSSWWDPIAAVLLKDALFPSRASCSPMDRVQLERFGFFRRIGIFGIDPDDPRSAGPMIDYVMDRMAEHPRPTLIITPQGRFADPRAPMEVRPGTAMLAARLTRHGRAPRVVGMAVEYPFWIDKRPEMLARVSDFGTPPDGSRASSWQRSIERGMAGNAAALAELAVSRDEGRFRTVVGRGSGAVHPVFDAWARLRGKSTAIDMSARRSAAVGTGGAK